MVPWLLGCALLAVTGCAVPPTAGSPPPHIVLIVADDLGAHDLSCTGSDYHRTPRIDGLAEQGLRFTQAHANAANCAPSRAALLTGQYAPRTGIYTVGSSARGKARNRRLVPIPNRTDLDDGVVTLGEALRDAGYATASIGKWHLGDDPRDDGFEHAVAGTAIGHPRSYHSPYRNPTLADGPDGEHLTDRMAAEAVDWLASDDPRPRFLYLPFFAVHTPIQPRADRLAEWQERPVGEHHTRPDYAALVAGMDDAVGTVLDALDARGMSDDTLVVFVSDNGGHGGITSNAPLRAAKGSFHQGGLRVPLIVRWPGHVASGRLDATPVLASDLFPTLLAAAGAPRPDQPCDGVDLTPLFANATAGDAAPSGGRPLFWHFPAYLEATESSDGPWRTTPVGVVRRGDHKLMEWFEDGRLALYDLAADPGESRDLSAARPALTAALHAELVAWREAIDAPLPDELEPRWSP